MFFPAPPNISLNDSYPVLTLPHQITDLATLKSDPLLNLTKNCLANQPPTITLLKDAHVPAFTTPPLFKIGDPTHQALRKIAVALFKGKRSCLVIPCQKIAEDFGIPVGSVTLTSFDRSSKKLPPILKEKGLLTSVPDQYNFALLDLAKKALEQAKKELLPNQQKALATFTGISNVCFDVVIQKGNTFGAFPHVDQQLEGAFSLVIPALPVNATSSDTPVENQNTLYKTASGSFKHVPIGQALIMFPEACPLIHSAPLNLSESVTENVDEARYIISFSIQKSTMRGDQKKLLEALGVDISSYNI